MTTAISNVANTDITDITIEQAGQNTAEIFMEEPLLDATKDYMVSVSELCIPLSEEPMLTYSLLDRDILSIKRRNVGFNIGNAAATLVPAGLYAPDLQMQENLKMFTPGDLVAFIAQWASGFSRRAYEVGLNEVDNVLANHNVLDNLNIRPSAGNALLQIGLTPAGVLFFNGSNKFWRNFFIELNPYAQSLLGVPESIVCLTGVGDDRKSSALLTGAGDLITDSGIQLDAASRYSYLAGQSVFRYIDERMYVSLEAGSLAMPLNQLIRDGVETKSHELATFPFETKYKTTIKTENEIVQASVGIEMDTYISRTHFLRKTDPTYSWYRLSSSYMVQNMRLELFITRRRYSDGIWIYTKEPMRIHDDGVWNTTLKFVSVH